MSNYPRLASITSSIWSLCPSNLYSLFLEHFFTFFNNRMFQAHLVLFLPQSLESTISSSSFRKVLKNQRSGQEMISLLLRFLRTQRWKMSILIYLSIIYQLSIYLSIYLCIYHLSVVDSLRTAPQLIPTSWYSNTYVILSSQKWSGH